MSEIASEGASLDELATPKPGCIVRIRYRDHVLFKDATASDYRPWTRETVGWLDQVGDDYVRIVWERYWDKTLRVEGRLRSTGLSITRLRTSLARPARPHRRKPGHPGP